MLLRNRQDIHDFVLGCMFYGVGGGGNPREGARALTEQLEAGRRIECIDPRQVPDDALTCCVFLMGSTAPLTPEKEQERNVLGLTTWRYERNLPEAVKELEDYVGKRIDVIVPLEVGGSNTPAPIAAAVALGKTAVDGDYAGRAVPEITQATPSIGGFSLAPACCVDKYGNKVVIREAISNPVAERIGKMISEAAFGSTGIAGFLMSGEHMKQFIIAGTASRALAVGRAIRAAREEGGDVPSAAAEASGGRIVFAGVLKERQWEDRDGYYQGYHFFDGTREFAGQGAKTYFKNETHALWVNEEPLVSSPDLIVALDANSGAPVLNNEMVSGQEVVMIAVPAAPFWRHPAGVAVLGPKHFGLMHEYRPFLAG